MAHCIAGGAESMSFIPMGLQAYLDYVAKQETKITMGNGFNSRSSCTTV
jgi:hypothetical protein